MERHIKVHVFRFSESWMGGRDQLQVGIRLSHVGSARALLLHYLS